MTSLLLSAGLLGGCLGNITSPDANTHVYELTPPELRFLCSWMDDTVETRPPDDDADAPSDEEICELEAAQESDDTSACYQHRSDCLSEREEESARYVAGKGCTKSVKTPPRACNATVAQIKACFIARQQELMDAAKAASCGDVRGSRLPGSTLVSCRDVFPACKTLFGALGTSELSLTMAPKVD